MQSEYLDPEDDGMTHTRDNEQAKKGSLERKGPATKNKDTVKERTPRVLHKDGSFADMPYNNNPGSGAEEGILGIGT